MSGPVVVTGAMGNVGSAVVAELVRRGIETRAADIHVHSIRDRFGDAVEPYSLDFKDPSTFPPIVEGASRVFLIRPPAISRVKTTLNRFLDVAEAAGVEHVVFSSVAGAESNSIVPHHKVEVHLQATTMDWTMLRPGFFAQNIGGAYRRDIVENDEIYVPAGDGLVSFIDARDIGELAAKILAEGGHAGEGYHVTGTEAVRFDRVAELLTEGLGRKITYRPASVVGYFSHLLKQGLVFPQALVQTILHTGLRKGDGEPVTDTLGNLLGHSPRSLEDYITDNLERWQPGT